MTSDTSPRIRFSLRHHTTEMVWLCWLLTTLAMFYSVFHYGRAFPWEDDFIYLPFIMDNKPLHADWLWAAHNEHRIPLPKFICWASLKLDGGTFTLVKYFYVAGLSGATALLLRAVKTARGRYSWTDVTLPLLLLGFQGIFNVLWFFQGQFVFSTILASVVLAIITTSRYNLSVSKACAAGLCITALPLCGANGLVIALPLIVWLLMSAALAFVMPHKSGIKTGVACLAGASLATALTLFYFHDLSRPAAAGPLKWSSIVESTAGLMAFGAGYAVRLHWKVAGIVAVIIVTATVVLLLAAMVRQRKFRFQIVSLLLFIGAFVAIALAIAIGRPVSPTVYLSYLQDRYALILTPLPLACYIAFSLGIFSPAAARAGSLAFTLLVMAMLPYNIYKGREWGRKFSRVFDHFHRDVNAGTPAWLIAAKYQGFDGISPWPSEFQNDLSHIKSKGKFGLSALNEDFPGDAFKTVSLAPYFKEGLNATWDPVSGMGEVTAGGPVLRFTFDSPQRIVALQMKFKGLNPDGTTAGGVLYYNYKTLGTPHDGQVYVSPGSIVMTKPFDHPTSEIRIQVPYPWVRYQMSDVIAIYAK